MFTETDTTPANWFTNIIRSFFSFMDRPIYALLGIMYQIFFNVSTIDIFNSETIMKFYGRVQLILGVFMLFQLAMTILRGIVNPDSFTDNKNGAGNLIMRISISLILLTLLMPISIPNASNEYEKQINNNGILFGTLYSLQHRILSNNTLGRLILGTNESSNFVSSNGSNNEQLEQASRIFTSTIIKGFYRINLLPEDQRTRHESGKDDAVFNENRVCKNIDDAILDAYTKVDASPGEIISLVNETCDSQANPGIINQIKTTIQTATGSTMYIFTYMPIVSFIVPLIFVVILLSFTVDVAIRAVKLAVLRLIAPVPIISYMDPKGSKDSAFNAWVKALTSTYLDLFIRLASIYFVIFLIQDMIVNGISYGDSSGIVRIFSVILIWIGLFAFARQAPKFIKQVLGMKDDAGKGVFSGFGEIGNALGIGAAAIGGIGAFNAARTASRTADIVNHGEDYANNIFNRGKHLVAGIVGGATGLGAGMSAAFNAKDHANRAVMETLQKRNATAISRGGSGSTFLGRTGANFSRLGLGDTRFDRETREISALKDIESTGKDLYTYLEGKGKTKGGALKLDGFTGSYTDSTGSAHTFNGTGLSLNDYLRAKQQAQHVYTYGDASSGIAAGTQSTFSFGGLVLDVNENNTAFEDDLAYAAGSAWAKDNWDASAGAYKDAGLQQKIQSYDEAAKYNVDASGNPAPVSFNRNDIASTSKVKTTSKAAGGRATRLGLEPGYRRRKANYGATDKK